MKHTLAFAALILTATPAIAESPFGDAKRVDDAELATMRGGFALPGGIGVALTVQMDVAVDGSLVLRTVFRADQGAPTLAVYAPAPGQKGPSWSAPTPPPGMGASAGAPVVIVDRAAGITTLEPNFVVPTTVAISSVGDSTVGAAPAGLSALAITVGGPAVVTEGGLVQVTAASNGTRISLSSTDASMMFVVNQLVGGAFLNSVQNTANNRVIDTATALNVNLTGAAATQAATAALRVQDIATDAAIRLAR